MTVKARDFLGTADRLLKTGVDEADLRSSISRSYYAVFSLVKRKTITGASYTGTGDHSTARREVEWRWSDLSDDFTSLQDARIESDYKLDTTVSRGRAEHFYRVADELFSSLQTR